MKRVHLAVALLMVLMISACGPLQAQPTAPPAAPATEMPRPQPTAESGQPAVSVGDLREDIPLLSKASNVVAATAADGYSLTYQSANSMEAAVSFYETEMPKYGWSYDSGQTTIVAGATAALFFTKGGETAAVSLTALGTSTLVAIQTGPGGGGGGAITPTSRPAGGGQRADVPLIGGATNVVAATTGGVYGLTYQAPTDLNAAITFYETEMPKLGWSYDSSQTTIVAGITAALSFEKEGETATISLTAQGTSTLVVIEVGPGGGGGGGTVVSTAPPAGGGQRADVPLIGGATNVVAATTGGVYGLTYQAPADLNAAITFYETEMPKLGWSYDADSTTIVAGITAALSFEKEGETATVSLTAQGTSTLVVIGVE